VQAKKRATTRSSTFHFFVPQKIKRAFTPTLASFRKEKASG